MNTTLKFDRVILTKELNEKFKQVGEVYEIANILENSFLLRDAKTRVALGVVSFEDFEKHFVVEENFKGWTPWTPLVGFDGQSDAFYRTNRKKTQVKFLTTKDRAECCCSKVNDFNLSFGIQMAYLRCMNKAREKQKIELEKKLKMVNHDIAENEAIIKKMVNSLEGLILMFYIFIKACEKYKFNFSINSNSKQAMSLRPKNTFESITVERDYFDYNFNKLFLKAIKIMKKYRKERGY